MSGLKKLRIFAPGLLPLVVLITAESIWGFKTGIYLAIGFGVLELIWNAIKERRIVNSIVIEIGMLVIFGIIEHFLDGRLTEHIKIITITGLLVVFVGVSVFSMYNFLLSTGGRYFKNINIGPWEAFQIKQTLKILFWFLVAYAIIYISALLFVNSYTEFLGGNGIIFFTGCFVLMIILQKIRTKKAIAAENEWLPIVTETGLVIGSAPRFAFHKSTEKWVHPVVHLHIIGKKGIWMQKRPHHKMVQPGKWDTAVGGHVSVNEPVELALVREAYEEIGLEIINPILLGKYIWESEIERELVFAFALNFNGTIIPNPTELDGGQYWSFDEIENNIGKNLFTPNFEFEYSLFKTELKFNSK